MGRRILRHGLRVLRSHHLTAPAEQLRFVTRPSRIASFVPNETEALPVLGFSVAGCLSSSGQRERRARVRAHPRTNENAQGTTGEQGLWVPRVGVGISGSEATI